MYALKELYLYNIYTCTCLTEFILKATIRKLRSIQLKLTHTIDCSLVYLTYWNQRITLSYHCYSWCMHASSLLVCYLTHSGSIFIINILFYGLWAYWFGLVPLLFYWLWAFLLTWPCACRNIRFILGNSGNATGAHGVFLETIFGKKL